MALGQPITSREESSERRLQEGKPQINVIITLYDRLLDRLLLIPTEQVVITHSPDRPIILSNVLEALVEGDWPAVKHATGIISKIRVSCLGN